MTCWHQSLGSEALPPLLAHCNFTVMFVMPVPLTVDQEVEHKSTRVGSLVAAVGVTRLTRVLDAGCR